MAAPRARSPTCRRTRSMHPAGHVSLSPRALRPRPRRRRRPDGRRHRPGAGCVRPSRLAPRRRPGAVERGLETMRRSLEKLAEKGGADPDEVLARVEPVDGIVEAELMIEAVVEDADVKEAIFSEADAILPPARHPRLQYLVHPDHHPGGRNRAAVTGDRHALLQPGAGDVARRGHPRAADLGRDRRRDRRARARARQDAGGGERLPGLRVQPHPHAVHQRGRVRACTTASQRRRRSTRSRSSASTIPSGRWRSPTSSASTRASRSWRCCTRGWVTRSTRRARSCASTSPPDASGRKSGQGFYDYAR